MNDKNEDVIALKWKVIIITILSITAHSVVYNAPLMYDDDKAILMNADVQVRRVFVACSPAA